MKFDPAEMAMILEQARHEAKKQKLAGKTTQTITFDGNIEGKYCIPMPGLDEESYKLVRVSEEPIDLTAETLKSLKIRTVTGEAMETKNEVTFRSVPEAGMTMVYHTYSNGDDEYRVCVVDQDFEEDGIEILAGVYFGWLYNGYMYTTSLSYEEIHPIPQEYIPPLDRLILNGADGNQYALTITDGAISVAPVTT